MAKPKNPKLNNKWISIFLGVIILLVVWFYFFQDYDNGFDFDEEKYIEEYLEDYNYEVNSVKLEGTTLSVDMNALVPKGSRDWEWQVYLGLSSSFYEVEPSAYDILKLPKKELKSLGINYEEIEYMSDDELEEVSEIIGNRASMFIVKMNSPNEVCSYRLSRATLRAWDKASEICLDCEITNSLYSKMQNEIKDSETCY